MMTRGCYIFTLLVSYGLSIPVPSDQVEKDDIKVMKCIVEVIADTLNKPRPIAVSQECQESLTGDERIVSILRHQNLLKELQEIAAEGVTERVHQQPQKKNEEVSDQVTDALGGPPDVEDTTGEQWEWPTAREGPAESGHAAEGGNEVEEEESREKSGESREGQEEEEQEEDEEETAQVEEEETHSSSGEEEGKGKEGNETEEEDSTQVNKDGEIEPTKGASAAESDEKRSKPEEEEEEAEEEEMEGEPENKRRFEGAEKESDEDEAKEERERGPGFQRWSKRGEESPRETTEASEAGEHTGAQGRNPMGEKQGSPQLLWYAPHHSKENSGEEERRSPAAQELHVMARGETEEEGSASHRGEDREIERLAAIETELESVAQRLHELRSG
ncbi:hypothetical protein SKAU_G00336630 [Synaphobranchus kaupii]|uniref:Chromogranin A n=1 Tax=Synaphobranchus kaupii TaxID=118154 RepID=A0A9Q1IIS6_SYNKA|nr:hypothetical protein SKAU_G00336630 [Synaphobranchus kaupii]